MKGTEVCMLRVRFFFLFFFFLRAHMLHAVTAAVLKVLLKVFVTARGQSAEKQPDQQRKQGFPSEDRIGKEK